MVSATDRFGYIVTRLKVASRAYSDMEILLAVIYNKLMGGFDGILNASVVKIRISAKGAEDAPRGSEGNLGIGRKGHGISIR